MGNGRVGEAVRPGAVRAVLHPPFSPSPLLPFLLFFAPADDGPATSRVLPDTATFISRYAAGEMATTFPAV